MNKKEKKQKKESSGIITRIIKIKGKSDLGKILPAADALKKGKLVSFPTETVYGLGADALNREAVKNIFIAKGRPSDNPFIIHVGSKKDVYVLAKNIPEIAEKLMDRFWPGPLTLVLNKSEIVPFETTGGRKTVAVRMPDNYIALELIRKAGVPVAAPSANTSSRPSATSAKHVIDDLNGKVDFVIDGGDSDIGLESTVLDLTSKVPLILRPGKITSEDIKKVLGKVDTYKKVDGKSVEAKAPGMKYKHYSPDAKIIIVEGPAEEVEKKVSELSMMYFRNGKKVKILSTSEKGGKEYYFMGSSERDFAKNMFNAFRELDKEKVDIILAGSISEEGLGTAIMNRMKKAAYKVIKV